MRSSNYWVSSHETRISLDHSVAGIGYWRWKVSRRRALRLGAGLGGAGLLALAGISCSDDDEGGQSGTSGEGSKLITAPKDTSSNAKPGGVYQGWRPMDETTWDPLATGRLVDAFLPVYSRLIAEKAAVGVPKEATFEGDLAESYELSPDKLTFTVRLRPVKWDPRPPTNSRVLAADDVVFSWNKFSTASPYAAELSYNRDKAVAVESVSAVDARTVAFKLKFPWSPLLPVMSTTSYVIEPREADGQFDPRSEMRGTGPWMRTEWQPAASVRFSKNPNYWRSGLPYMDGLANPILSEAAAQVAQFKAKTIWDTGGGMLASDMVELMKTQSELQFYERRRGPQVWAIAMSSKTDSPFKDRRVRQAVSLALDRDAMAVVETGADVYAQAGLDLQFRFASCLSPVWGGHWIDPTGSGLGEGAKFYKRDIGEAKKLLAAAGHQNGLETVFQASPLETTIAPIITGMLQEAGINAKINVIAPFTTYLNQIAFANQGFVGNYDGIANRGSVGFNPSVMAYLQGAWKTGGSSPLTRDYDGSEQTQINKLIEEGVQTFDEKRVQDITQQIQKLHAVHMGGVPRYFDGFFPGNAAFTAVYPWINNWEVFQTFVSTNSMEGQYSRRLEHVWIDESKKT